MIDRETARAAIKSGEAVLGLEFGSTRIKAVLIDGNHKPIAMGVHDWENHLENGVWTYSLEDIITGLQDCYRSLKEDVQEKYSVTLTKLGTIGISGMMHGYMVFDKDGQLLVPFRSWRNTITGEAAGKLTELFSFNVPQRWSIAHLYQAILNKEDHVKDIAYMTTLAGYIHWQLTGKKVVGIGEAAGMFPIDSDALDYDRIMMAKFDELVNPKGYPWRLREILPGVLCAGADAGTLTKEGALLLDPTGELMPGCILCPPEGDAGTGMAATNSVAVGTGNVSAGTSVFAMVVTEKPLAHVHEEIDMVTTPDGHPVAMVHCNNCSSDLNAWIGLLREFGEQFGLNIPSDELYGSLFKLAMEGAKDGGGLVSYNYYSGEPVMGTNAGCPLFMRDPDAEMDLADFMRVQLMSSLATLKIGLDILLKDEAVPLTSITGHGGLFKTAKVAQFILAAAINAPVTVMETAGEGGPWGMALLAAYEKETHGEIPLDDYLNSQIFAGESGITMEPDPKDVAGFDAFLEKYRKGLDAERCAAERMVQVRQKNVRL
ncbi:MAG: FGGY-family carbohydrate kinase [Clostridiales bacterium]|nr:FGGY-family carbohydrate kinase [Clostridiales bacterium]